MCVLKHVCPAGRKAWLRCVERGELLLMGKENMPVPRFYERVQEGRGVNGIKIQGFALRVSLWGTGEMRSNRRFSAVLPAASPAVR